MLIRGNLPFPISPARHQVWLEEEPERLAKEKRGKLAREEKPKVKHRQDEKARVDKLTGDERAREGAKWKPWNDEHERQRAQSAAEAKEEKDRADGRRLEERKQREEETRTVAERDYKRRKATEDLAAARKAKSDEDREALREENRAMARAKQAGWDAWYAQNPQIAT